MARSQALELVLDDPASRRRDGVRLARWFSEQPHASKTRLVERHRDVVGVTLADVLNRRVDLEVLSHSDRVRHDEAHVEARIAHEHTAVGCSGDLH